VPHPASDAFLQAAGQAGYDVVDDYNGAEQEGAGVVQVNQRRGRRSQSSREYLRRGSARPTVRTGAFVTRILTRGDRAEGVEYRHHRSIAVAHARREVIVSAGTLVSPKLLMVSGIGPEHELRRHGIRTVADTPGVGSNLADHIGVLLRWNARIPTLNEMKAGDALRAVWEYARHGTGTLAATVFQVQVILRTSPDLALPDIQLAFASFAINRRGPDGALKVRLAKTNSVMVTVAMLHPRSTATIRLRSADPAASPVIDQQMLADTDDVADLMAGMTEARRIVAQPAMAGIVSTPFDAEAECATDEDWRRFVRDNATYGVHPVGTCRMGIDDLAVVDPELRVHGVGGLRVVDASVMPTTTSGNTNAPVMMIAERAADLILGTGS
jgi:choline dehydrogenase